MSVENSSSALSLDERIERVLRASEATARAAESDRKAIVESAEASRKTIVESAEASRKTIVEAAEAGRKAVLDLANANLKAAEADRDRLARLEEKLAKELKDSEGNRSNFARGLEDIFAASLPRAIQKTHGIIIRQEDVRVRARKDNNSREYDFVAPNGELVLVGEVKARLTLGDVAKLSDSLLSNDFRDTFPEYAHLPIYGVVAGGVIDEDAARLARKLGFIILRMEGGEVHPATGGGYQPKKF